MLLIHTTRTEKDRRNQKFLYESMNFIDLFSVMGLFVSNFIFLMGFKKQHLRQIWYFIATWQNNIFCIIFYCSLCTTELQAANNTWSEKGALKIGKIIQQHFIAVAHLFPQADGAMHLTTRAVRSVCSLPEESLVWKHGYILRTPLDWFVTFRTR